MMGWVWTLLGSGDGVNRTGWCVRGEGGFRGALGNEVGCDGG